MNAGIRAPLGATPLTGDSCSFKVWAPFVDWVDIHIPFPTEQLCRLARIGSGYHFGVVENVPIGSRYCYRLNGSNELSDPASRFQPEGVHQASQVVGSAFPWTDESWRGLSAVDLIIYELHVGTLSIEGTFEGVVKNLERIGDLGVTAIELMPVAQFPGGRNWGYDGVYPFAVQNSYGGPMGLRKLVDACHSRGLAVVLDVVYNHLGPEGNYFARFGPYFTDRYRTPWGPAINFDGPHSDEVRHFFIENALYWVTEFHVDALRLDAVHGIFDFSALHFLEELASAVHCRADELNRQVLVIAESDLNDSRLIKPKDLGGYGLDGQWNDDFHHALHTLLTNERMGYYEDFGELSQLTKAFGEGYVFSGEFSAYRQRKHGNSSAGIPPNRFVVFSQNHDQVGNRSMGDRLSQTISFEKLKLAAGAVLLSPNIPLLFMGEEYGETGLFPYFVSHSDPFLIDAVRQGRKDEFTAFQWQGEPMDPQDEATFARAKLNHYLRKETSHAVLYEFYRELLKLRKTIRSATRYGTEGGDIIDWQEEKLLLVAVSGSSQSFVHLFHFGAVEAAVRFPISAGSWKKVLDSTESQWDGPGSLLPIKIVSDGSVEARLQPHAVYVFANF